MLFSVLQWLIFPNKNIDIGKDLEFDFGVEVFEPRSLSSSFSKGGEREVSILAVYGSLGMERFWKMRNIEISDRRFK